MSLAGHPFIISVCVQGIKLLPTGVVNNVISDKFKMATRLVTV